MSSAKYSIYLSHISKFDNEKLKSKDFIMFYCGELRNCPKKAEYLIGIVVKSQIDDKSKMLNWFLGREITRAGKFLEIEILGKNEVINNYNSNVIVNVEMNSNKFNDFTCMSLLDLKWNLKNHGDYKFVETFLKNYPADYEKYRYEVEKDCARIVFEARKSTQYF